MSKRLSQNFLINRKLVSKLINRSSIEKNDLVYEIGPGKGIITEELSLKAGKIIAIELDKRLCKALKDKFSKKNNVEIINNDFLKFRIFAKKYKIFSNIPFAVEGIIVRKILDGFNPPDDMYLVMDRRVADRFCGIPREGKFSISHKPWFEMEIFYHFKKYDFWPQPSIDTVLMRSNKRENILLPWRERKNFERFVELIFGGGARMKQNLKSVFTKEEIVQLSQKYKFGLTDMPSTLKVEQWVGIYDFKSSR